jgi:type II secretory pathway component GspD/PulD (secretin)
VEQKPAEPKPPEPKPAEAKPAEPKPAEQKPVEAKPPEAKPAESKPAEAAKPGPSYTLLARPAVADRLKLSDEQRAKVALLLAERRESLEKATEADRAKVLEQSEKKLGEVLSDAQRADFTKIPPEPLLKFKFRFQRWVDVLEEVARQAGLSLVLDAPPPGTLNYSDDKEYTPTEAIDLLNSVLLTKGYTLIRRDRMLVCVSIEEGIPEGLVPRVTLDELDYRGKFELVTVVFPVEGRAPAAAAEEIKPLLSPLGKVVPLPATSQLLITDTAGKMRDLRAQIKAVPAKAPTAVAQPAKAEPPVFTIYPLKGVDPASVLTVMKTLYPAPASNFVLDPKTDQLSVHAGASVQASVKAILEEMMKTGQPAEKQSRLELYTIDESRGPQILKSLEGIAPNAKLTLDTKGGRIVAWATGADQDLLKKALEKLGMGPVSEARQFEVYRLTKADPKSALALLESLLPTARLAVDAPTNSLVVIGTAADQKAVKSLLEQL